MRPEPIAIVGMACLFPKAPDLAAYWHQIAAGRDAIGPVPPGHSWSPEDFYDADPHAPDRTWATRGGFLEPTPFDPLVHGIPPNALESIDTTQLLALMVARSALRDAGCDPDASDWNRERTATILGVTGTQELAVSLGSRLHGATWRRSMIRCGIDPALADIVAKDIGAHMPTWTEQSFPGLLGNVVSGRIANRLDLGGTNCVVDAACGSSLAAVQMAVDDLRTGRSDLALSGGADTLNDAFMFQCFTRTPALSRQGDSRPFDASSDGILIGEGIAILAMMRLSDAEAARKRIYAVLHTVSSSSDGRSKSIYAPNPTGQARALRRAFSETGFPARSIGLVEAHGTGTKAGDAAEVSALIDVYRSESDEVGWCALGSVKAQIGHTKSTAGAAGLVKAALALHERVLPPAAKVERPNPKLGLDGSPFHLPREARPWSRNGSTPRRAAVSAFGFGGSNFHALLEEHVATPPSGFATGVPAFAVSGTDAAELLDALASLRGPDPLPHRANASLARFAPGRFVAAFRASDDAALEAAISAVRGTLSGSPSTDGVFVGRDLEPARVAVLFPGQGSQFVGMGAADAVRHVAFRSALDDADDALREAGALPVGPVVYPPTAWDDGAREAQEAALRDTRVAQPALGAVSLATWRVLEGAGLVPNAVAGHSFGELVALHAAGVWDAATVMRIAAIRGEAMGGADRGTMMAVSAPLSVLDELAAASGGDLVLANRNHPEQGVLAGTNHAIDAAARTLEAGGHRVKRLQVSAAFHSPLVADAVHALTEALATAPVAAPRCPVWANVTAAPYPSEPDAIRELLAMQVASPVRFDELVSGLIDSGIRVFVECGPKAALTGLVRRIGRGRGVTAIATGAPDSAEPLTDALLALAAAGVAVDLTVLCHRTGPAVEPRTRTTVDLAGANVRFPDTLEPPMPKLPEPKRDPVGWEAVPSSSRPLTPPPPLAAPTTAPSAGPPVDEGMATLLDHTRRTLAAFQELQERTADVHRQFLEQADRANATFASLFQSHQRLVEASLTGEVVRVPRAPAAPTLPLAPKLTPPPTVHVAPSPSTPESAALAALEGFGVAPAGATAVARPLELPPILDAAAAVAARRGPGEPVVHRAGPSRDDLKAAVFASVATKTGFPRDLLEGRMDLESDLGVDSIKRVEILSAVQEALPGLPEMDNDRMAALRTLDAVIDALTSAVGSEATTTAPAAPSSKWSSDQLAGAVMDAVARKTGFPRDLLELRMDLESDLGVDSIKRVEILSAVQEALPGLPEMDNERMATLRTLGAVVDALVGASEPARPADVQPGRRSLQRRVLTRGRISTGSPAPIPAGPVVVVGERGPSVAAALAEHGWDARAASADPATWPAGVVGLVDLHALDGAVDAFAAFSRARHLGPCAVFATVRPESGTTAAALDGLARTVALEWPSTRTRAIAIAASSSDGAIADLVATERGLVDLGHDGASAYALLDQRRKVPAPSKFTLGPDDSVLVTGGARGVTAEVAVALAAHFRCKLVLVGRTPEADDPSWAIGEPDDGLLAAAARAPDFRGDPRGAQAAAARVRGTREVARTRARIEAHGAELRVLSVDLRDASALREALAGTPITGLIHGAGVLADKRLVDKTDAQFEAVWTTKVDGLAATLAALDLGMLRFAIAFGSIAGRYGNVGQVDYAMANEAVAGVMRDLAHRGTPATTLCWGPWAGGMVTPELVRHFEGQGRAAIPLDLGAAAVIAELRAGLPDATVVLEAARPLDGSVAVPLDASRDVWLNDHAIDAKAVLPVAAVAARMIGLGRDLWPDAAAVEILDLAVLRGIDVSTPLDLRLNWTTHDGVANVSLVDADGVDRYRARLRPAEVPAPAPTLKASEPFPRELDSAQRDWLFHGPRFRKLTAIDGISDATILGQIAPGEPADVGQTDADGLDVAAFDAMLQLMVLWVRARSDCAALPTALGSLTVASRPAGQRAVAVALRPSGSVGRFDAWLSDGSGATVAHLRDGSWAARKALNAAFRATA